MSAKKKEKTFDPKKYRVAAFDLDGTLLSGRERIHEPVKAALLALRERGVCVVASSGRNETQLTKELLGCFQYAVLSNGSMVIDAASGELLFSHPIDRIIALYTIDRIQKMGGSCFAQQGAFMLSPLKPMKLILGECKKYPVAKRFASARELVRIFYGCGTPCRDTLAAAQKTEEPFYKLQAFFETPEAAEAAVAPLHAETGLEALAMNDGTLELTAPGVSKANALKELSERLGYTEANIAAFGDSMNDAEMLSRAGYSVAMRNGDPRLMELADRIASPVREDGAAKMIRTLWRL